MFRPVPFAAAALTSLALAGAGLAGPAAATPAATTVTAGAQVSATATAPARMRLKFFHTPSGNIRCGAMKAGGRWSLRCDIYEHDWTAPPRPTPCDFGDYGSSVGMGRKSKARFLCVSDAMDEGSTLTYGRSLTVGPFFCTSKPKGLKCYNARAHGWFLSRQKYRLS